MSEQQLDPRTFDVADMFAGVSYPTTVETFYTNAGIAYEFNKLAHEAKDAVERKDEDAAKAVEKRREELLKESEKFRFEFHLRGQSRDDREALRDAVLAEFPDGEPDLFGRRTPNPEAEKAYVNRFWALHIEKIVRGDGAILLPDEATVRIIRGQAPDSEIDKIEAAIQELSTGSKSGFESLAQEHDFLSSASHEA